MQNEILKDPATATEVAVFQKGEEILSDGQECPFFFVILSGQVELSRDGKKIRTLREQDIFGLESLLLRRPSRYSAEAVQTSRVASYGPEALDHFIRECPRMIRNVLISVLDQLTQTTSNLVDFPQRLIADRERILFCKDGDVILDETGCETEIYRLISTEGELKVTLEGREVARISKPGEFFGFPIFCAHVCVTSIGESVVEKYGADDLDYMVRDYPEAAGRIMRTMIERLRDRTEVLGA